MSHGLIYKSLSGYVCVYVTTLGRVDCQLSEGLSQVILALYPCYCQSQRMMLLNMKLKLE